MSAVLASVFLAGCAQLNNPNAPSPVAAPAPSTWLITPSVPASASVTAPPTRPTAEADGAPPGTETCAQLGTAIKQATLMQPGVVARIVAAAATADAPVADSAKRLATAYATAVTSNGTPQEPDAVAAVSAAAADMDGVCNESGLERTG